MRMWADGRRARRGRATPRAGGAPVDAAIELRGAVLAGERMLHRLESPFAAFGMTRGFGDPRVEDWRRDVRELVARTHPGREGGFDPPTDPAANPLGVSSRAQQAADLRSWLGELRELAGG
jgi:hypothetical protein